MEQVAVVVAEPELGVLEDELEFAHVFADLVECIDGSTLGVIC